jgi:hypothetical protein
MLKTKISVLFFFIFCSTSLKVKAQVFSDVTSAYGIASMNGSTMYGSGSSCFDVNEDGWDDLTICVAGGATRLYINNQGVFELLTAFENSVDSKTCLWGDFDEDGDNDLFVFRRNAPSQLFVQTDSLVFVNQSSSLNFDYSPSYNTYGAALGDYNRDSFLDVYVANYATTPSGSKSILLTNNQTGTFSCSTHGHSKNHFQPTFIDLFRDLYQDIFVINDFATGNELYTQDASGVFTDQTPGGSFGLYGIPHLDAMCNSWCDYDNDADFDVYITNTPTDGNFLYRNNGLASFINVASGVGARLNKWSWSGLWLDIENDGWNDLVIDTKHINPNIVNGFGNYVLRNNQGIFSQDNSTGISDLPYAFFTSSKGDFNNDGLYDLYLGPESEQQSQVFQNNTVTSNNYVKCRLKGRLSNHNGVGTHIDYYLDGEHRIHYTQLGENYLCQNSQNNIFGIGDNVQIDSLKLSWISGVVDTYYNIPANTTHVFVEGETMPQIQASKAFLCPNGIDSLELSIPGWPAHTWGNGSTDENIWVTASGVYSVVVGTGFGHTLQLNYEVQMASVDNYAINTTPASCAGDSAGSIELVNLSSGQTVYAISNLSAGDYTVPITLFEGCISEQYALIEEPLPFTLQVDSVVNTCFGYSDGSALVQGIEGTAPYAGFNEYGLLHLNNLLPGNYTDTITDANGCAAIYTFAIAEIPEAIIEITSPHWVCVGESVVFEATVSGVGDNYFWDVLSPGISLGAGSYVTAIVDSFQCVTTIDVVVEEISAPTIEATIASESVLGLGNINLDVVGNYPPYTATWQSGFVGLNNTELSQGNYIVSVADSFGCAVDTMFTVLFNFVEEEVSNAEFIIDWKTEQLIYTGSERLFEVEVFDSIGQLLLSKSSLGSNEIIQLNVSPQMIFISSSTGNSRTKILLK